MLALVLAAALPSAAHGATAVRVGTGIEPSVAVTTDGTAYIAWNGYENPSTIGFCRLPRGATSCAVSTSIPATGGHRHR